MFAAQHTYAHRAQKDIDRFTNHRRNFYSTDWEYIPFTTLYSTAPEIVIERPKQLSELLGVSEKLACAIGKPPFVRIDMYVLPDRLLFGEITFFHGSGYEQFYPKSYDRILGDLIRLPEINDHE